MRQKLEIEHRLDSDGNPAGGSVVGSGIQISFQDGPLQGNEPTGAFVEGLIEATISRIRFYQNAADGKFKCRQNAVAITKLEEALHWLEDRTRERTERGVEGTYQV